MINKEDSNVEYYKLTPLEAYQKNKADKNKTTIEGENWSKYIFFIVFKGNHKLKIYKTILERFKTVSMFAGDKIGSVSAVDNNIYIQ